MDDEAPGIGSTIGQVSERLDSGSDVAHRKGRKGRLRRKRNVRGGMVILDDGVDNGKGTGARQGKVRGRGEEVKKRSIEFVQSDTVK